MDYNKIIGVIWISSEQFMEARAEVDSSGIDAITATSFFNIYRRRTTVDALPNLISILVEVDRVPFRVNSRNKPLVKSVHLTRTFNVKKYLRRRNFYNSSKID